MEAAGASLSDEELVRHALAGRADAFEQLVHRYFSQIFALAYVRVRHREAAEDVTQEAFLRAYLHLEALGDPGRFAAWISRITRNLACTWKRRDRRLTEIIARVAGQEALTGIPDGHSQEGLPMMEANERHQALDDAIFRLPPEQGELILLHFSEDLGVPEIARRLEVHPSTVRRQLKRAQASIKAALTAIVHDSLATFRPSSRATAGTMALIGALSRLPGETRAGIIQASGGTAWLSSVSHSSGATAGPQGLFAAARQIASGITSGSKAMIIVKGLAAAAVATALLIGGMHTLSKRSGYIVPAQQANHVQQTVARKDTPPIPSPQATDPVRLAAPAASEQPDVPTIIDVVSPAATGVIAPPQPSADLLADAQPRVEPPVAAPAQVVATGSPAVAAPAESAEAPVRFDRARTIQFPRDRSLGQLKIRPRRPREGQDWYEEWQDYGQATGLVTVPANTDLGLWVSPDGGRDLSPLADLKPGDIQRLDVDYLDLPTPQWQHVGELRGVETLHVTRSNLNDDDVAHFRRMHSLLRLHLTECRALTDRSVAPLQELPALESLSLRYASLTDAGLEGLASLPHLKNLDLGYTAIRGAGFKHLAKIRALERLNLMGTRISDESLASLAGLSSLRELNLQQTPIGDEGLAHLEGLTTLEQLALGGTLLRPGEPVITSHITDAGLCHLKGMTRMKTLHLDEIDAGDSGLACLENMKGLTYLSPPRRATDASLETIGRLTGLKTLCLQGTRITGSGLHHLKDLHALTLQLPSGMTDEHLAEVAKLDSLQGLWLQGSPAVTDAGITQLRNLKSLREVMLSGLNISPESYALVREWPALRYLGLQPPKGLPRFADGTSWLKYVENLPALETLGLNYTDVLNQDMSHLRNLPMLRNLWIPGTGVTDAGLAVLRSCPSLGWIDARQTKITEAGAAQLPGTHVHLPSGQIVAPSRSPGRSESQWQQYVRQFIETYGLDSGQQQTAHSILREACDEAARYRQSHQRDFAELDQQLTGLGAAPEAAARTPGNLTELKSLKQRREQLETPIQVDLFNRLKERLDQIPTGDQRQPAP